MSVVTILMGESEFIIESVAVEPLSALCGLPLGTLSIVNNVFSGSGSNQTRQTSSSTSSSTSSGSNSSKEFWEMVGAGLGGAIAGAASSPQNSPTWKDTLYGTGEGLKTWADDQSGGSINDEIYYDHKVHLSDQQEQFAYLTSSRSLADTYSSACSRTNPQYSLTVGEKTVLAANDLRKSGYYSSKRFNDIVETALTGHQNEQARAIKKVGADLEYYRGF